MGNSGENASNPLEKRRGISEKYPVVLVNPLYNAL